MNKRTMKKGLAIVLALVIVFAMATTAFAVSGIPGNNGQYLEGTAIPPDSTNAACSAYAVTTPATSTNAKITLIVEAGDAFEGYEIQENSAFREVITVNLTATSAQNFTVENVLKAAEQGNSGIGFSIKQTANGPYLESVEHGNFTWEKGQIGFDGWVFRVNDKFPVVATTDGVGYEGTSIGNTYVKDGDVVHFFYDFPSQLQASIPSLAANYIRGTLTSWTASSLTVQMQGHKTDIQATSPYIMSVNNYENIGMGISVKLYSIDVSGALTLVATGTTDTNGQVVFSGSFSAGTKYIVQTESEKYTMTDPNWSDWVNDVYFTRTGAYSKMEL